MNMLAQYNAMRRGACPGLSAPMPTGDGLLVRFYPTATMPLDALTALFHAGAACGNGIVEITARGSIQFRGLNAVSAPRFADRVAALGIAASDGTPVLTDRLSGIAADEIYDATALAAELRRAIAAEDLTGQMAPKTSVIIGGGSALSLNALAADLRLDPLNMHRGVMLRIAVGGDRPGAALVGLVPPEHGLEAALRILRVLARRGRETRARDVIRTEGVGSFQAALGRLISAGHEADDLEAANSRSMEESVTIGQHRLNDDTLAIGFALAFGQCDVAALEQLVDAIRTAGGVGLRAASERALLAIGIPQRHVAGFVAAAERLGFIVAPDDERLRVIACPGAPACATAVIAARALAPRLAQIIGTDAAKDFTLHITGCIKGCAHPSAAPLTIVGTAQGCALIADGTARDRAVATVAVADLPDAVTAFLRERGAEARHV